MKEDLLNILNACQPCGQSCVIEVELWCFYDTLIKAESLLRQIAPAAFLWWSLMVKILKKYTLAYKLSI